MSQDKNMNLLALDTATEACSVALSFNHETSAHFERCPREHTKKILPMVENLMQQAQAEFSQLDAIIFGQGPGSFTGVRIGVAAAQGLAFGAQVPMIGISTLAAMAQQAMDEQSAEYVVAAIDARMGEIYHAVYRNEKGIAVLEDNEIVVDPSQLPDASPIDAVGVGTGWVTYSELLSEKYPQVKRLEIELPRAYDMLKLGKQALANGQTQLPAQAQPVYLRDKVTWKKLPGRD